jgi:hypothetical protein
MSLISELVISRETFSAILTEFSQDIRTSKENTHCLGFVTELVTSLYTGDIRLTPHLHSNTAEEELLLSLFQLCCSHRKGDNTAWCTGVSALARLLGNCSETFHQFTLKFTQVVKKELVKKLV